MTQPATFRLRISREGRDSRSDTRSVRTIPLGGAAFFSLMLNLRLAANFDLPVASKTLGKRFNLRFQHVTYHALSYVLGEKIQSMSNWNHPRGRGSMNIFQALRVYKSSGSPSKYISSSSKQHNKAKDETNSQFAFNIQIPQIKSNTTTSKPPTQTNRPSQWPAHPSPTTPPPRPRSKPPPSNPWLSPLSARPRSTTTPSTTLTRPSTVSTPLPRRGGHLLSAGLSAMLRENSGIGNLNIMELEHCRIDRAVWRKTVIPYIENI